LESGERTRRGVFFSPPEKQLRYDGGYLVFVALLSHALQALSQPLLIPKLPALRAKMVADPNTVGFVPDLAASECQTHLR
jgi:hypothetical protein